LFQRSRKWGRAQKKEIQKSSGRLAPFSQNGLGVPGGTDVFEPEGGKRGGRIIQKRGNNGRPSLEGQRRKRRSRLYREKGYFSSFCTRGGNWQWTVQWFRRVVTLQKKRKSWRICFFFGGGGPKNSSWVDTFRKKLNLTR